MQTICDLQRLCYRFHKSNKKGIYDMEKETSINLNTQNKKKYLLEFSTLQQHF